MRLRHLALPAAVTLAALTGLATPAAAAPDDEPAFVALVVPEQVTVIEGKTKSVTATVINASDVTAKGVALTFTKIDASVAVTLPAGCDLPTGCAVGELKPGASRKYTFKVTPNVATSADLTSSLSLKVTGADGVAGDEAQVAIVRAKGGVDLEVADIADMKLNRGQTADVPITVRNAGSETVDAIGVVLFGEDGLVALTEYRNCEDQSEDGLNAVVCVFEQNFPAGAEFTVPSATPLQIKVAADAGGPYTYTAAVVAVGINKVVADSLAAKSGPTLKLQSIEDDYTDAPDDLNEDDNVAAFGITLGKSAADLQAIGGTFKGAVGDETTVQVGVRNLGPTATVPPSLDGILTVTVDLPTGIEVTDGDDTCFPDLSGDPSRYTCLLLNRVGVGKSELFSFTATILDSPEHTAGSVIVDGGVQDTNSANDKAVLGLELTGGGAGGGLPVTGAPAGWVAAGGALLLLIGGIFFSAARRRRIITKA
ncbi:COG1361 family protein [Paractinoplanes durhamensis]|uniref:LPXTG-motif cell wall anchor domain-containing protein n=1 Tax=Paractinoplanes durhamensis TaxID=113563 RepID=A0ABQ3Z156_9ACTN|nr:hypothetical protein [Actinoplanes durhamensis]GIE03541.1 hypothetical protein Adu01nite_48910 [Actinoplanes durhamensis]